MDGELPRYHQRTNNPITCLSSRKRRRRPGNGEPIDTPGSTFATLQRPRFLRRIQLEGGGAQPAPPALSVPVIFSITIKPLGHVSYNGWPLILIQSAMSADNTTMFNSKSFLYGAYFLRGGRLLIPHPLNSLLFVLIIQVAPGRNPDRLVVLNTAWLRTDLVTEPLLPNSRVPVS